MSAFTSTVEAFFTERLIGQRHASPNTIAAYRDTVRLLLGFATARSGIEPCRLDFPQLDAGAIAAFLDHIQHERGCSARTRNARLAAIRSLYRYAALRHPEHIALIERVLAIPQKRFERTIITFLEETELDALLAAPDQSTWSGRRDHTMIVLAAQTGLRAAELVGLTCADVHLGAGAHVTCLGKGRKQRITPLIQETVAVLSTWLTERGGAADEPLFPTSTGRQLSRDALERRLAKHSARAAEHCRSLRAKKVTPHVLRHTAAMRLLHADVDTTVIALWLGHEQIESTQIYIHADLAIKEKALAKTKPLNGTLGRYHPPDTLLAFLEAL